VIKLSGISAVIAKSFARIFYRNAINVGLPVIVCETDQIEEGDLLELDLERNTLKDVTRSIEMRFLPLPPLMRSILREGGLVSYIKKYGDLKMK
jgi:3-isopropylmalate/(R)-2-methylmalate dehydratase small subunit